MLNMKNKTNEKIYQCHPEHPTHVILNLIQDLNRDAECPQHDGMGSESGRSMVEMLGVLAIIGVLSVMGIAGYKAAMTRHRANELLNEATKRAAVVAGQITLHGHSPSLSEFENTNDFSGGRFEGRVYGTSGTADWTNSGASPDQSFTLAITGVEGSVCELMQGIAADNAIIQGFAPNSCDSDNLNTVKLTYNNDLGTEPVTPTQAPCPTGVSRARDGSCSVCDNEKVYLSYNENPCEEEVSGDCTSNDDCVTGEEYCHIEGDGDCDLATGTCTPLGGSSSASITGIGTVLKSDDCMNWWSADNWCKAQGRSLISVAQLRCYAGGTTLKEDHTGAHFYCCAEGHNCGNWSGYWNGKNIISGYEERVNTDYSPTIIALRQAFGGNWFWVNNAYSSCSAAAVDLRPGYVDNSGRNNPGDPDWDANAAYCH